MSDLILCACGALIVLAVRWLLKAPSPQRKASAEPDCIHCRGLGYDASGFGCPCVKEAK